MFGISAIEFDLGENSITTLNGKRLNYFEHENTLQIQADTANRCIEKANIKPNEIDCIISYATANQFVSPQNGNLIGKVINAHNAITFNIEMGCSSFVYAMYLSNMLFKTNANINNVLITLLFNSSLLFRFNNEQYDYSDCTASVLVSRNHGKIIFLDSIINSYNQFAFNKVVSCPDGFFWYNTPVQKYIVKDFGDSNISELTKFALNAVPQTMLQLIEKNKLTIDDISGVILHQSKLTSKWIQKLNLKNNQFPAFFEIFGNFGTVNIPFQLKFALEENLFSANDLILCASTGLGWNTGSLLIKW